MKERGLFSYRDKIKILKSIYNKEALLFYHWGEWGQGFVASYYFCCFKFCFSRLLCFGDSVSNLRYYDDVFRKQYGTIQNPLYDCRRGEHCIQHHFSGAVCCSRDWPHKTNSLGILFTPHSCGVLIFQFFCLSLLLLRGDFVSDSRLCVWHHGSVSF
jgi:hypothetical protein